MISVNKLGTLPRNQRLRKIEKIFAKAEDQLYAEEGLSGFLYDQTFFADTAGLLAADSLFSPEARSFFKDASIVLKSDISTEEAHGIDALRRVLNGVKHILLNETGRSQADWDFSGGDYSLADGSGLDPAKRQVFEGMRVYLEDIRSPFNVGAMFRTAESFGVERIYLSPFCADPHHNRALRTAMGCIDIVPWERQNFFAAAENAAPEISDEPCPVFALETGGVPISEFTFPRRGLLIAGSEELGVSPAALAAADASLGRVSIPCYGTKASLNVSVAFGIAVQAWGEALTLDCSHIQS